MSQESIEQDDMLPEYDFSGKQGTRGKYYQDYRKGHMVEVEQADGTIVGTTFRCRKALFCLNQMSGSTFPTRKR